MSQSHVLGVDGFRVSHSPFYECFPGQLNIWGFNRVEDSKTGWRHDNFVRGDVDGIALIKRIELKGNSTTSKQGKRSRRTSTTSKASYSSSTVPDLAASVGSVSESKGSSVSSNSAETPLEVMMTNMSSSTAPSEPTTQETTQSAPPQLRMSRSGLLSVPSQVSYNPDMSSEYIQYAVPPAFLAQTTASLIQPIDPISISQSMFGGPPSNYSDQHAQQMTETEEDAFDVAIRELFS